MTQSKTEHLEGRVVRIDHTGYPVEDHGMPNTVLVVGVERSIGITLVDPCDTTNEILCINGPCSPHLKDNPSLINEDYDEIFDNLVRQIEDGKIKPMEAGMHRGVPVCAFKA